MQRWVPGLTLALLAGAVVAATPGLPVSQAPASARVYIISPADGATVGRELVVRFGLVGMGVAPAGIVQPHTGHHHLLIDVASLPKAGQPIPADAQHRHFGGGQTEVALTLTPGTHTLQLELADAHHVPFDPPLRSAKITVHVQ